MKNKSIFLLIILFQYLFFNISLCEEFIFEAKEIEILEKGNLVKATGNVRTVSADGTEIQGKETAYYRENLILKIKDNVIIDDKLNNIKINAEEGIYYKKKEIIKISKNVIVDDKLRNIITKGDEVIYDRNKNTVKISKNVIIDDKLNSIKINAKEIFYNKKHEIISSKGKAFANIKNQYKIESTDLFHNRKQMKIYSDKKTVMEDNLGNIFELGGFNFDIKKELLNAKKIVLFDNKNNKYFMENSLIDLKINEIVGKEIHIDFDNSLFGNKENEPRLKGKSIAANSQESTIYKGAFTTCKKNKDKCPPWSIYAEEVTHKKNEKIIEYKHAWLKIYDKPVAYFPYFFHPDPTVKRQSGFLMPKLINSNNFGTSIQIPYYNVISENKDLTFTPKIFFKNNIILQTEYRQANKNSDVIFDFGIKREKSDTETHFFSNFNRNLENRNLEINIEKVSNDNYLKINKITSPLINNTSTLNSFVNFDSFGESYNFNTSIEVYEDMSKINSDRFEYIYPSFKYEKNLKTNHQFDGGKLDFSSEGFQKKYNTNVYEASLVNDLNYTSKLSISPKGFQNNYRFLLRNVNSTSNNSTIYKEDENYKILSTIILDSRYPLIRNTEKFNDYLTPIFSLRYSPNATKNYVDLDTRLNFNNVFTIDRIGKNDMVEGGASITAGIEYSKKDKEDNDYINLRIANVIRNEKNYDLPTKSTLGNKRSDVIGNLNFNPSNFFNLEYEFSLENDLTRSNYNFLKTDFKINNFVTSFDFLEEDNFIGNKSYLTNKSTLNLNENKSVSFETSKNLDKNITEYYNLIYEYKNDCLTASIEYNKEYYSDNDLKPEENLFFSIKIIPFGEINIPNINQ